MEDSPISNTDKPKPKAEKEKKKREKKLKKEKSTTEDIESNSISDNAEKDEKPHSGDQSVRRQLKQPFSFKKTDPRT